MKDKLYEYIPEFNLIKDENLKQKTAMVYERALKEGNWLLDDLKSIPFTLLIENCSINIIEHIRGVTGVCIKTAETLRSIYGDRLKLNQDYLISGALLHDIGKLLEYAKKNGKFVKSENGKYLRHPFSGVALCYACELPVEVCHIVAVHAKEGDMGFRSPEAVILHHADFINFAAPQSQIAIPLTISGQ